jgi:hypothetical protein
MRQTHDDEGRAEFAAVAECLRHCLAAEQCHRGRPKKRGKTNDGEKYRQGYTRPPAPSGEVENESRRHPVHDDPHTDIGPDAGPERTAAGSVHEAEDGLEDTRRDRDSPSDGGYSNGGDHVS